MRLPRPSDYMPWEGASRQGLNTWCKLMLALTILLPLFLNSGGLILLRWVF